MLALQTAFSVFSVLPDAIVIIDEEQRIRFCNEMTERLFGYTADELEGQDLSVLIPHRFRDVHVKHVEGFREPGDRRPMSDRPVLAGVTKSGAEVPISVALCNFEADGTQFHTAVIRSQSKVASTFLRMLSVAETDSLTKLGNRRYFERRLVHVAQSAGAFSLIYLDLDRFKPLNDRYGHAFGDAVLRVVGERLRGSLRQGDCVARMGGDEFAVLLDGAIGGPLLTEIGRKILARVGAPMNIDGQVATVGVSVGAIACRGPRSGKDVLDEVDGLMYRAKQSDGEHLVVEDATGAR